MKFFSDANQWFVIALLVLLCSCSPFSKIAEHTAVKNDDSYLAVVNPVASLKALTFGDFEFATNRKEYKSLHGSKSPYSDMLVYAKTSQPTYEYYILYNPKKEDFDAQNFLVKDTLIGQSRFIMLISNKAPQKDVEFLHNAISAY